MKEILKEYKKNLCLQVKTFEKHHGNIVNYYQKHFYLAQHNMIREDDFLFPDLDGLIKYEKWLYGGNKKR